MWKILLPKIRKAVYDLLVNRGLVPEDTKGCRKVNDTLINKTSRRLRRDGKMNLGHGLTTKCHMTWSSKLDNRLYKNVQDFKRSHKFHPEYHEKIERRIVSKTEKA